MVRYDRNVTKTILCSFNSKYTNFFFHAAGKLTDKELEEKKEYGKIIFGLQLKFPGVSTAQHKAVFREEAGSNTKLMPDWKTSGFMEPWVEYKEIWHRAAFLVFLKLFFLKHQKGKRQKYLLEGS